MLLERIPLTYSGACRLNYLIVDSLRSCELAEEAEDFNDPGLWAVRYHVVYCPTRYAVEYGSIKAWLNKAEGLVEDTASRLVELLREPDFELARVFVGVEERHPGGWSRDMVTAEYSASDATSMGPRFDRVVNAIILGAYCDQ